jgi:hypothetical protein
MPYLPLDDCATHQDEMLADERNTTRPDDLTECRIQSWPVWDRRLNAKAPTPLQQTNASLRQKRNETL